MLEGYNLYLNIDNDSFIIKNVEEFSKYVTFEMKYFKGKENLNLNPITIEELEKTIQKVNDNNKNKISFFLIRKNEDIEF